MFAVAGKVTFTPPVAALKLNGVKRCAWSSACVTAERLIQVAFATVSLVPSRAVLPSRRGRVQVDHLCCIRRSTSGCIAVTADKHDLAHVVHDRRTVIPPAMDRVCHEAP